MKAHSIIVANGLSKTFNHTIRGSKSWRNFFVGGERQAVKAISQVSFTITAGERVALIGPNGAGKSTVIKILTGLLEPDKGTATVAGLTPWISRRKLAMNIGCVFGNISQLWAHLTVKENLLLIGQIYSLPKKGIEAKIGALSLQFGISDVLFQRPNTLSLGERMKCEIAGALLHEPKILLLDEPSIGLDISARLNLRHSIREQCSKEGTTVLLTSHDTGDIEGVAERVIVISGGTTVFDDSLTQLRGRFATDRVMRVISLEDSFAISDSRLSVAMVAPHTFSIRFNPQTIATEEAVSLLLASGRIADLTIGELPLEEVIAKAFAEVR